MSSCLLDKLVDGTGLLDFRSTGSKSKQARPDLAPMCTPLYPKRPV